ncbi:MAG: helix-turn-helix domain-containing protein [Euryarchaeota archaeon]|nr:helix-turn-helix domain-containing protein [Euryarchaeota archaeon]
MRRYKYSKRTYMMLFGLLFTFTSLLVVAMAQEPVDREERVLTGGEDLLVPQPDDLIAEYRAPIMTISVVGLLATGGALAFSGGVKYIDRKNVLDNPVRRDMYAYIRQNPGVYLREISRTLDINPTNTTWHLRKLSEAELVRCQMANGLKLYYPLEGGVKTKQTALINSILKNDNAKTIVAYLLAHPGSHQREIARALGVNHGTVRWHLKKLAAANIINEHRDGAAFDYYVSSDGMEILASSGEMGDMIALSEAEETPLPMGDDNTDTALERPS